MPRTFSDDNNIYSVDMMIAYINIFKPKTIRINTNDYLEMLSFPGWGNPKTGEFYSPMDVIKKPKKYSQEMTQIKSANLKYPIILDDKNQVIDGIHRLSRAYLENISQLKAYRFDKSLMKKFLIDNTGNWNKIDSLETYYFIQLFYERFLR